MLELLPESRPLTTPSPEWIFPMRHHGRHRRPDSVFHPARPKTMKCACKCYTQGPSGMMETEFETNRKIFAIVAKIFFGDKKFVVSVKG